jgi:hypothetical protein
MSKKNKIIKGDRKHKSWRVNYTVTYSDKICALYHREKVLETLKNIAFFRGIEVKTSLDFPFYNEEFFEEHPNLRGILSDLVYFRSSHQTKISAKDFRKIVDHIFEEHCFLGLGRHPFEVGAQMQKVLPQYPFPI